MFHLPRHSIHFQEADPLGGGLKEEIELERLEPEAISLIEDDVAANEAFWQEVKRDIERDPDWFTFSED